MIANLYNLENLSAQNRNEVIDALERNFNTKYPTEIRGFSRAALVKLYVLRNDMGTAYLINERRLIVNADDKNMVGLIQTMLGLSEQALDWSSSD